MSPIQDRKRLEMFLETKHEAHLWSGLFPAQTPQGVEYWEERYWWLLFNRQFSTRIIHQSIKSSSMSEGDYSYLRSLIHKSDPFLEDKENKEFLVE